MIALICKVEAGGASGGRRGQQGAGEVPLQGLGHPQVPGGGGAGTQEQEEGGLHLWRRKRTDGRTGIGDATKGS